MINKAATPLAVATLTILVLMLWKVPQWQVGRVSRLSSKERFDRVNEARKTLATILGGVLLLLGFFGTWENIRVAQEAASISQQGQITDRFTKAIDQLGSTDSDDKPRVEVRLGGIYALERIANDSERDHWPTMEVLCTYVRQNAPRKRESLSDEKDRAVRETRKNQAAPPPPQPRADIQAILTVLGRRNANYKTDKQHLDLHDTELQEANLNAADLRGAILYGASLRGAILYGANLNAADLRGADLSGTVLTGANLRGADLSGADLSGANLVAADLRGANLIQANLSEVFGANLGGANLSGAYLGGADLTSAIELTQAQIDSAHGDPDTKLPPDLRMPDSWKQ